MPHATETFAAAVGSAGRAPPPTPRACVEGEHERIVALARLLAADLKSTSKHYHGFGSRGIFSPSYNGSKTGFMFDKLSASQPTVP